MDDNRVTVRIYDPSVEGFEPRVVLSIIIDGFNHGTTDLLKSIGLAIESGSLSNLIAEIKVGKDLEKNK